MPRKIRDAKIQNSRYGRQERLMNVNGPCIVQSVQMKRANNGDQEHDTNNT